MQQNNMQMQPMMGASASQNQVTTDIIQQYLDENKQLILAILENQNAGNIEEYVQNQAKLQRNLMYLAAIADNQSLGPGGAQYSPNAVMQSGVGGMQNQQSQQMTPQSLVPGRPSMFYAQSPLSALQRPQQMAFSSHLGVGAGCTSSGFDTVGGESSLGVGGSGVFPGFVFGGSGREEGGSALPADRRGDSSSGGQSGDGTQLLYLKAPGEE